MLCVQKWADLLQRLGSKKLGFFCPNNQVSLAKPPKMSFGFSIGDIIAVGTRCMNVYNRCKGSRGDFKEFSIKALNMHWILSVVEDGWRAQNLSEGHRMKLEGLGLPVAELLRELERRLQEYGSLGRKTPASICDQIGWAWKGGGTEFEKKLDSHINSLNLFYNRPVHDLD